jgi:imidazolonepropionase-like amidohydrolase
MPADPSNGYRKDLTGDPGPANGVINSATCAVLSQAKDGANTQFTEEEIKSIVAAAKDYGFKEAARAHGAEGMKRAIRAGVNSIEHGTFLVPTIIARKSTADSAKIPDYYPAIVTPKAFATLPKIQASFAKAYKAGVKIAFGTDAGVFPHGKTGSNLFIW